MSFIVTASALSSFKLSTTYDAFAEESIYTVYPVMPSLKEPFLISAFSIRLTLSSHMVPFIPNVIEILWLIYSVSDGISTEKSFVSPALIS